MTRGLSDMWRSVLMFIPAALLFLAILAVGYVLARLTRAVVAKVLRRLHVDQAVDRGSLGRALRAAKVDAVELCAKIVFYGVLLIALELAFSVWGPNPAGDLLNVLVGWLPRLLVAIVIVLVALAVAGAVADLIGTALGGLSYGRLLARVASALIVTLGVIAALDQVKIATAVTEPLLIAVLATIGGIVVVGVGGGLIRPMESRWEGWLQRASAESAAIRDQSRAYAQEKAAEQARPAPAPTTVVPRGVGEETVPVVIPVRNVSTAETQRVPTVDDRPHIVPGFDRDEAPGFDRDETQQTRVLPEAEETQVITTKQIRPPSDPGSAAS